MLHCDIHLKSLPTRSGCYVVTSISINFKEALEVTLSNPRDSFVLQSLHKVLTSTTVRYKACTNHFPVLLCNTKLAKNTPQYYFVLQRLHNTFQYYFVLQSLHKTRSSTTLYYKACKKLLPSTTSYYKACTRHSAVLLCSTKLAQSTPQYYFVLQ